jgi:hypothetical protein
VALPPSRAELSTVTHGAASGYRVAAGGHSASASAAPALPVDLGAGYVYEAVADNEGQHGNYLELGWRLWQRGATRAFASARAEVFWNDVGALGTTRAASARLSLERVLGHVAGGTSDRQSAVGIHGLFAPGIYLEAGARSLQRGDVAGSVAAGVYVRLPLVLAASRPGPWR